MAVPLTGLAEMILTPKDPWQWDGDILDFNSLNKSSSFSILNLAGSEVKKGRLEHKENDLSDFKEGQYLIQIKNENDLITKSFSFVK